MILDFWAKTSGTYSNLYVTILLKVTIAIKEKVPFELDTTALYFAIAFS